MVCFKHHLLTERVAAAATAIGESSATSCCWPRSSKNLLPSSEDHPTLLHVATSAVAGPLTCLHTVPLALLSFSAAPLYAALMSSRLAQFSQYAVAQVLIGATCAAYDGSVDVQTGATACIESLGFLPLAGGVMAAAARLTVCFRVESAIPEHSTPYIIAGIPAA